MFKPAPQYYTLTAKIAEWIESLGPWLKQNNMLPADHPLRMWTYDVTNEFPKAPFDVDYRVVVKLAYDWDLGKTVNGSTTPTWTVSFHSKNPNITRYLMTWWTGQSLPGYHTRWHTPFDSLWEQRVQNYYSSVNLDVHLTPGCGGTGDSCWAPCLTPQQELPPIPKFKKKLGPCGC